MRTHKAKMPIPVSAGTKQREACPLAIAFHRSPVFLVSGTCLPSLLANYIDMFEPISTSQVKNRAG